MKRSLLLLLTTLIYLASTNAYAGYYEQGSRYYTYKNYNKAREMFLKAVEASDDGNAYYFLGEIEKNEGNYDKAIEYYKASTGKRINGKYLNLAYWNIIILTEQRGDYPGMVRICRELYNRTGDQGAKTKVESLINKSLWTDNKDAQDEYQKGIEFKKNGQTAESESAFRKALQIDSTFLAPQFELGLMYFKKGNTSEALSYLREVAQKIPFYGEVHLLLGDIYIQKGWHRDAIPHYEEALDFGFLDSGTKYLINMKLATSYYNIRDYAKTREMVALAARTNPKALEPLLLLSSISIKEENYSEALKTLEKAQKLDPENPEILFLIGSMYYKMNNAKFAGYFSRLYEITDTRDSDVPQKYYKAFALLMKYYFEHDDFSRAGAIFESIPEKSRDYDIILAYARAQLRLGNPEKGLKPMENLYLKSDEDRYLLCQLYAHTGKSDRAKQTLLGISNRAAYMEKARRDPALKTIAGEIEEEQRKSVEIQR